MSMPVKYCALVQAADDANAFRRLHPVMKKNLEGGHFTIVPCQCDPPCRDLAGQEVENLWKRFREAAEG